MKKTIEPDDFTYGPTQIIGLTKGDVNLMKVSGNIVRDQARALDDTIIETTGLTDAEIMELGRSGRLRIVQHDGSNVEHYFMDDSELFRVNPIEMVVTDGKVTVSRVIEKPKKQNPARVN